MVLTFRLDGLAETFVDSALCPDCGNNGGLMGNEDFNTKRTKVTYDGIVVVLECEQCGLIFVPKDQRHGIIDGHALRDAVKQDSQNTGEPIFPDRKAVVLDTERLNAQRKSGIQ